MYDLEEKNYKEYLFKQRTKKIGLYLHTQQEIFTKRLMIKENNQYKYGLFFLVF